MTSEAQARPVYESPTGDIIIPDNRQRTKVNQKKFEEIKRSVETYGQLQPGMCRLNNGSGAPVLVTGYTRFTICHQLGIPFRYELKEDLTDPYAIEEIELHENIMRDDLHWKDVVRARNRLHELWQKTKGGPGGLAHSISASARGMNMPQSLLSEDIKLAMFAEQVPEVASAPTKSEAKKIIKRIESQINRHEELKQAVAKEEAKLQASRKEAAATGAPTPAQPKAQEQLLLNLNKRIICGDMLTEIPNRFEEESIDFVWFDPPWGVDFGANALPTGSKSTYQDDAEWVRENLPIWLSLLFTHMKPESHLYLKFGITTYQETLNALISTGFKCNGIPIIWHKKGAHRTRTPKYSHGRSYEPIFFARKGAKPLSLGGREDTITTGITPKKLSAEHRSAAHPDLHIELLRRSCQPGAVVLDPMCGAGAFGVAAEHIRKQLILDYTEIEISKPSRDLAFQNLLIGYDSLIAEAPIEETEAEEFADDAYTAMKPGSSDWMKFWVARPDLHEEMTAWHKSQRKGAA